MLKRSSAPSTKIRRGEVLPSTLITPVSLLLLYHYPRAMTSTYGMKFSTLMAHKACNHEIISNSIAWRSSSSPRTGQGRQRRTVGQRPARFSATPVCARGE
jgi:hypothetical protein